MANVACGVGRSGSRTAAAPTQSGKVMALPSPYAENNLTAEKQTSSGRIPRTLTPHSWLVMTMLRWQCTSALGRRVEPDEYSQKHSSSGLATAAGSLEGASPIRPTTLSSSPTSTGSTWRGRCAELATAASTSPANSDEWTTAAQRESSIMNL